MFENLFLGFSNTLLPAGCRNLCYQTSVASAMALVMFAIVMLVTLFQWRGQKKWVNY